MPVTLRGTRLLAADPGASDNYGYAVAISSNGLVMAVGAPFWDGGTYTDQGCVYIYDWSGSAWVARGSVIVAGDVAANGDEFGSSVALSADGTVLAVGAPKRNDTYTDQGGLYIYDWSGSAWSQRGSTIVPSAPGPYYYWGTSVALSDDGTVLAYGSPVSYQVYVYDYSGGAWVYRSVIAAAFGGAAVAMSGSGSVIAIGAPGKDTSFTDDGGVYIYDWSGSAWAVRGSLLRAADSTNYGRFGVGLALSTDGLTLAVGAYNFTGVADYRGGVYLFDYAGGTWVKRGSTIVSTDGTDSVVGFYNPALSSDASVLVVGGPTYDATYTSQGAVYTYDVTLDNFVSAPTSLTLTASIGTASAPTALTLEDRVVAYTSLVITSPTGNASASTRLAVTASGNATAATTLALLTTGMIPNWTARCVIDGVDVSARLEGVISVTADEGAARIAGLAINPASGTISPLDYVGKSIMLDYVPVIGGTEVPLRLFTGRIDTPSYDPNTRLLSLTCVDDLQNRVASLPRSVIDGLVGGRYTTAVQGDILDNWDYAAARMTTVAASLDAGPSGGMRVTPWEMGTNWATYGDADLLYQRTEIRYPQRSTLVNHVSIDYAYRYPRLRQRYTSMGWSGPLIDMAPCGYAYPTQQDVLGAANGTGWKVTLGIFYPAPATIPHSSGGHITTATGAIDMAIVYLTQRHSQTVTESYALTVSAFESVSANGELPYSLRGALASGFDGNAWESALDVPPLMPDGGEQDYAPDATRADSDYAIQTLLDQARVKILSSHRGARVVNAVLCNPDLDPDKHVTIATADMAVSGKVASVTHTLELGSGSAISEFSIACFGAGGAGIITPTTLAPPAAPDAAAATQDWLTSIQPLYTNTFGVTPYNVNLMGLLLNPPETIFVDNIPPLASSASFPNPYYVAGSYPVTGFRVQMPGVDDSDRNPLNKPVSAAYSILIPSDTLTFTVP
jgi:hypothetical protein